MAKTVYDRSKSPNIILKDKNLEVEETFIAPDVTALIEADQPDRALGFQGGVPGYFMTGAFNPFGGGGSQVLFDQFFYVDLVQPAGPDGPTYLQFNLSNTAAIEKMPLSMVVFDYGGAIPFPSKISFPEMSEDGRIYDKFLLNPDGTIKLYQIIFIAYIPVSIASQA